MTHEEVKNKIKSFWTDEKLGQEFEEKCEDYCTYGEDYGEDLEYESAYDYYTNHCMGGAVEYDLMEDMERWARENGIDCDEETLSDVTREIITEQPWCDSFVSRGRSSNSDYDKLKSSFDNLFDNKNNKYEMKHLKKINELTSDTWKESFDANDGGIESKLDEVYEILIERIDELGIEDLYAAEEMMQNVVMSYLKDKLWSDEELSNHLEKKEFGDKNN